MTKQHKETSRAIKKLIQKAKKGNLLSIFQLYENYSSGKYVEEKDEALSQQYFNVLSLKLPKAKLTIKSLNLYEFRRFRSLDIDFDDRLTVIIGKNGVGKTSIVDAIAKSFTWFNNNLDKKSNARPVTLSDINVNSSDYGEITTTIELSEHSQFETSLTKIISGNPNTKSSEVIDIKLAGLIYRHMAPHNNVSIPLLAYYSVERSDFKLTQTISEKATKDASINRFGALTDALEGSGKLDDFSELYIELVNLAEGKPTSEVKELREQISSYESLILLAYKDNEPPIGDPILKALNELREELADTLNLNRSNKHRKQLALINKAIESIVPNVTNFEVDRSSGKLKLMVSNFGNRVNISQLSQGQKTLVALIGDIARRLVTLNPEAENALEGHGIVIIDEVELHLHPKWQQEILLGLQSTFPNIQFIVTTHSAQVLSTVDKNCIRILSFDESGAAYIDSPKLQTKGVCSSDVLEQIMGTFSIPPVCEANWLADYSALVAENLWESEKGLKLFDDIVKHFGAEHPEIIKIKGDIRTQEFKLKAKALKGL
jgi:predicted ATP-binding protein involved in virulence